MDVALHYMLFPALGKENPELYPQPGFPSGDAVAEWVLWRYEQGVDLAPQLLYYLTAAPHHQQYVAMFLLRKIGYLVIGLPDEREQMMYWYVWNRDGYMSLIQNAQYWLGP